MVSVPSQAWLLLSPPDQDAEGNIAASGRFLCRSIMGKGRGAYLWGPAFGALGSWGYLQQFLRSPPSDSWDEIFICSAPTVVKMALEAES